MDKYKNINSTLMWICALSLIIYFIFLPFNNTRPNPKQSSPVENEKILRLEANPLLLFRDEKEVEKLTATSSQPVEQFPNALVPIVNE